MQRCRILSRNSFYFSKKIFFILLCSLFLFSFLNVDKIYAAKYKFDSYIPHKCFEPVVFRYSEIDSRYEDETVECRCHLYRPPIPKRGKIYYTSISDADKKLFRSWYEYIDRSAGTFNFYVFHYNPKDENVEWRPKKYHRDRPRKESCEIRLKAAKEKYQYILDQKRKERNEKVE